MKDSERILGSPHISSKLFDKITMTSKKNLMSTTGYAYATLIPYFS